MSYGEEKTEKMINSSCHLEKKVAETLNFGNKITILCA